MGTIANEFQGHHTALPLRRNQIDFRKVSAVALCIPAEEGENP